MAAPAKVNEQNILPVQALFNVDNSFNTFIGQGQPFVVSATESIGIQDITTLNATLYPTLSPVNTGQVTSLDVTSTKFTFNPFTGVLSVPTVSGNLTGRADTATNLVGGGPGQIVYQSALNGTAFVPAGSSGQVLTSNGTGAPTWTSATFYAAVTDDTTTNSTFYPLFGAQTSGNLVTTYTSSTKYKFNPSTGLLTATGFVGSGANLTSIPNTALVNSSFNLGSTAIFLGDTKTTIAGLASVTSTSFTGNLTGNASTATSATNATNATNIGITDNTSTNATYYPTFVSNSTGNLPATVSSTKFQYNPSTGALTAPVFASTVATGTAPFTVASTTPVANLSIGGNAATATTLSGTVAIANGGTGATTAVGALTNLGAYPASNPSGYGTGTVTSVAATAGTGISVTGSPITTSGTLTITNTAPDQTVAIASGTGISVTGTYPNFTVTNTSPSSGGTVTSVSGTGTVSGLSLSGTVTTSGSLTLGGTLDLSSPPAIGSTAANTGAFTTLSATSLDNTIIGGTTPAAGTFTTLTATGQTSLGGAAGSESLRVIAVSGATRYQEQYGSVSTNILNYSKGPSGNPGFTWITQGTGNHDFATGSTQTNVQLRVANTASAVNYVQVTGAATGGSPTFSAQGSDGSISFAFNQKGSGNLNFQTSGVTRHRVNGSDGSVDSGLSSSGGVSLKALPVTNQVNYLQAAGNATGLGVQFSAQGSDPNISQVFQPKGTGAIDLAAGSSGVNISNGGTVTAITRTNAGTSYTSLPSIAITAPTTAGGVQAVLAVTLQVALAAVASGGSGYAVGDTITLVGGTGTATTFTVATLSGSAVATLTVTNNGSYTVVPSNPVATTTNGAGTGCTVNMTWGITIPTITNAGSGYVEQPTVTFSGGGGSGAAAYATVGSGTTVRSVGSTMSFLTPGGEGFRVVDSAASNTNWVASRGSTTGAAVEIFSGGADGDVAFVFGAKGVGPLRFSTARDNSGNLGSDQVRFTHTASAVNYVQMTGAATGGAPTISAQGSDANPNVAIFPKGLGIVLMNQQTPTAVTATGTLTIANLLTQIVTATSATAVSLTLPTGTLSDAGVSGGTSAVNTSFDWSIINTGSAVGDVTLVAGTGHTIVGSAVVTVGTSGRFRSRKTATNTFVTYRV